MTSRALRRIKRVNRLIAAEYDDKKELLRIIWQCAVAVAAGFGVLHIVSYLIYWGWPL